MWNARLDESQAGIKTARRNINNLRYADDINLMAESEEELSLLMRVKESERAGLKFNVKKTKIMTSSSITLWQIEGEKLYTVADFFFLGSKITADSDFAHKCPYNQRCGFSISPVWIWELDHEEDWAPKNWCFQTVVLEKTSESPLDRKEIRPVNPKGNQPWIFAGGTDAEAPILWPPDAKSQLIRKDSDAGKDWRQKEKGAAGDEMVR